MNKWLYVSFWQKCNGLTCSGKSLKIPLSYGVCSPGTTIRVKKRQLPSRSRSVYFWYLTQNTMSWTSLSKSFPVEIISSFYLKGNGPWLHLYVQSALLLFACKWMLTELSHNGICLPILLRLNNEYQGAWELSASTRHVFNPSAASYHRLLSFYVPLAKKLIVTVLMLKYVHRSHSAACSCPVCYNYY